MFFFAGTDNGLLKLAAGIPAAALLIVKSSNFENQAALGWPDKTTIRMSRSLYRYVAAALVLVALGACRKNPLNNLSSDESRIYITNREATANFASYRTFSVADTVLVVDGSNVQSQANATDRAFIDALKKYMQERGYQLVPKSSNPELGLQISRIVRTSTGIVDWGGWWNNGWGTGFWGPGWGWGPGPGWWGGGVSLYQVREGMLSMDMVDIKNAPANGNQLRIIWNGLIRGEGIFNASTADSQTKQLFDQSPYIRR